MYFNFQAIGIIRSPFKEKFGIPRQPGLVSKVQSELELLPPFDREEAVRGLEGFSHLWLIFVFHACKKTPQQLTVRPPRLGGNRRLGVFATRGTHRPNPVGMSAVRLEGIRRDHGKLSLRLKGADLLDGTPILDIKPYLPYADSIMDACGSFADTPPEPVLAVSFTPEALRRCTQLAAARPGLQELIVQMLQYDPRPAYRRGQGEERIYGIRLFDLDVRWCVRDECALVVELATIPAPG